jgi:hypothetical protein
MKFLKLTFASLVAISIMSVSAFAQDETAPAADEAAPAPAAPPAGGGGATFASLDSDSDGSVTIEEFKANFVAGGGAQGRTPQPDRIFGRWDADGDGMLTAEEYENRPRRQQGQGQR